MHDPIRWGILGPGAISRKFAAGLRDAAGARLVAVGSRDRERARAFAADFDAPNAHAGYAALVADDQVDAIYVGTPHAFHREHSILALRAGKHVLCEKPLALNAGQAAEMIRVAGEQRRVLMEAVWTRFLPAIVRLRELLADGAIGEPRMVQADFGFRVGYDHKQRLFDPALGGGALLDVGVYPVNLAHMVLGAPERVLGAARLGPTGVDEEGAALLVHPGGRHAVLAMALRLDTPREARILGTEGSIRIHHPWWAASRLTLIRPGRDDEILDLPFTGNGYAHEAEAFMDLIRSGKSESEVMPPAESLAVLKTMDALRAQWGLRYPTE